MPESLQITLPEPFHEWVQRQVTRKGYGSANDYVLELLRQEQLREVRDRVDATLLDAVESGPATEMTADDWQRIRQEGQRRAADQRTAG